MYVSNSNTLTGCHPRSLRSQLSPPSMLTCIFILMSLYFRFLPVCTPVGMNKTEVSE